MNFSGMESAYLYALNVLQHDVTDALVVSFDVSVGASLPDRKQNINIIRIPAVILSSQL